MVNIIVAGAVALMATTIGFELIQGSERSLRIQMLANVIIAVTTVGAVIINYFSMNSHKDGRKWTVNKYALITVSNTLTDLMSDTRKMSDGGDEQDSTIIQTFPSDAALYARFEGELVLTAKIYGPINYTLLTEIEKYRKSYARINDDLKVKKINIIEAYHSLSLVQESLLKMLKQNIHKYEVEKAHNVAP